MNNQQPEQQELQSMVAGLTKAEAAKFLAIIEQLGRAENERLGSSVAFEPAGHRVAIIL